jgi:hypothetical protein
MVNDAALRSLMRNQRMLMPQQEIGPSQLVMARDYFRRSPGEEICAVPASRSHKRRASMELRGFLSLMVVFVVSFFSTADAGGRSQTCWKDGYGSGQLVADEDRLQASAWTSIDPLDPCFGGDADAEAQAWNDGGTGADVDTDSDTAEAYKEDTNQAPYYGIQTAYTTNIYRCPCGDTYIGDGHQVQRQDDAGWYPLK